VETALDQEEGLRDASKYRAILRSVADGCTERNAIAQRTGLPNDAALRDKLSRLVELGYLETRRNVDARPNEAVRYGIADPAFRFHQRFVEPNLSMLERYPAEQLWASQVAPFLDAYMGLEFERLAGQAYDRRREELGLPLVRTWGRWEGADRTRRSLEIDLVAPLADGRVMTGAVKWDRQPVGPTVHRAHLEMLRRAADAGRSWAHQALAPEAPLFYVAAAGFTSDFEAAVAASGHTALCWRLEDLYG
jgi:AAA+ ATPase superfamily predicted ATPase